METRGQENKDAGAGVGVREPEGVCITIVHVQVLWAMARPPGVGDAVLDYVFTRI